MSEEIGPHIDDNDIDQEEKENKNKYIDNLLLLKEFECKDILANLEKKFIEKDIIYSYIGHSILIALNPQKELGIYNEETRNIYKKYFKDIKNDPSTPEPPAHLYYLVEDSYKDMIEKGKNQTFIISGDSGSGKTESAKYLINYLINSSKGEINNYIIYGNEILESFGNAKTERNDNSSRFGKLISINFSKEGKIIDAHFETYLLEKSRLVKIGQQERNYHIFYQLILGSNEEEKKKYKLKNLNYYKYLNNKEKDELPNDEINFHNLKNKLKIFLTEEEIDNLFKIISGILYLGNIQFEVKEGINILEAHIKENSKDDLKQASYLFGMTVNNLEKILTTFEGYFTIKEIDVEMSRDYISKEIYSKLFNYLIRKINNKMKTHAIKDDKSYRIGILDIFGFENLENNSFEQLCINYTNERLQKYFNNHVIKLEQELYLKEGLDFQKIEYKDDKAVIRLIDGDKKKEIIELNENNNDNINEILKLINKNGPNYTKINDLLIKNNKTIIEKTKEEIKKFIEENNSNNEHIQNLINIVSNQKIINELIDKISLNNEEIGKLTKLTNSINKILNDPFRGNKDIDESFRDKVYDELHDSYKDILIKDKIEKKNFIIIKHYAAKIEYNIKNFVIKNKSNIPNSKFELIQEIFGKSKNKNNLINKLFEEKLENKSLLAYFKQQLDELFKIFEMSNNKYIKCIKTKVKDKREKYFDPGLVEEQMNYGGILEAIKIKKQGYSIRKTKQEFFDEYKILFPGIKGEVFNDEIISNMVKSIKEFDDKQNPCKKANIDLIKIGKKDNIFMREDLKIFLDNIKNKYLLEIINLMVNKITNFIKRKKLL